MTCTYRRDGQHCEAREDGPHDHDRPAMPIAAAGTRTIDTMDSVFSCACEMLGSLESTREVSALM
jgi:hypothetical protein